MILSMMLFDQMFFLAAFFSYLKIFQEVIANAFVRDLGGIIHFCTILYGTQHSCIGHHGKGGIRTMATIACVAAAQLQLL